MAFTESDWDAYVPLTIDNTKVAATMPDAGESGFPCVLVIDNANSINYEGGAANIFTTVVAYANDIAVTLDDGATQLKHDVVEYVATGGSELLVCHILVPSLAGASDTILRVYYRDDGAADQQQTVYLAADGWGAYWPLHEDAAGTGTADVYKDLSDNVNHGNDYISAAGKTGQVGLGQQLDGSNDYIEIPDHASLNGTVPLTVMWWAKPDDTTDKIVFCQNTDDYTDGTLFHVSGGLWEVRGNFANACAAITTGSWQHMVGRHAGTGATDLEIFKDAISQETGAGGADDPSGHDKWIGWMIHLNRPLEGYLDELSISNAARSDNWITTTYNCQFANDTFWTVGAEVPVIAGSIPVILKMSRPRIMPARMVA